MNDGEQSKSQPRPPVPPAGPAGPSQATLPRDTAREALQQSLDRRW